MPLIGINAKVSQQDTRPTWEKILDATLKAAQIANAGVGAVEAIKTGKANRENLKADNTYQTNKLTEDKANNAFTQKYQTDTLNLNKTKEENDTAYHNADLALKNKELTLKQANAEKEKQGKFMAGAESEQGKAYGETQSGAVKASEQMTYIDDALNGLKEYSKNSVAGTGPLATGFGLKKYFDEPTQNLESKFRMVDLRNMVSTFQGMSKAVDSQTERAAWESTQPSLKNDDTVNANILLGSKAIAMKAQLEAKAQKAWVESGHGNLQGYETPILGKTKALMGKDGQMIIVPDEQVQNAMKNGYETLDHYVQREYGTMPAKKEGGKTPSSGATAAPISEAPAQVPQVQHMSTDELMKSLMTGK